MSEIEDPIEATIVDEAVPISTDPILESNLSGTELVEIPALPGQITEREAQHGDVMTEALHNMRMRNEQKNERMRRPKTFPEYFAKVIDRNFDGLIESVFTELQKAGKHKEEVWRVAWMISRYIYPKIAEKMKIRGCQNWEALDPADSEFGGFLENCGSGVFEKMIKNGLVKGVSKDGFTSYGMDLIVLSIRNPDTSGLSDYWRERLMWIEDKRGLGEILSSSGVKARFLYSLKKRRQEFKIDTEALTASQDELSFGEAMEIFLQNMRSKFSGFSENSGIREFSESEVDSQIHWLISKEFLAIGASETMPISPESIAGLLLRMKDSMLNFGQDTSLEDEKMIDDLSVLDKLNEKIKVLLLRRHINWQAIGVLGERIDKKFLGLEEKIRKAEETKGFFPRRKAILAIRAEADEKIVVPEAVEALYSAMEYAYQLFLVGKKCSEKYKGSQRNHGELLMEIAKVYMDRLNKIAVTIDMQLEISESGLGEIPEGIYALASVPNPQSLQNELTRRALELDSVLRGIERVRSEGLEIE